MTDASSPTLFPDDDPTKLAHEALAAAVAFYGKLLVHERRRALRAEHEAKAMRDQIVAHEKRAHEAIVEATHKICELEGKLQLAEAGLANAQEQLARTEEQISEAVLAGVEATRGALLTAEEVARIRATDEEVARERAAGLVEGMLDAERAATFCALWDSQTRYREEREERQAANRETSDA